MAPQKSPCVWYSRPWFVLLLKPNVRTSSHRHSPRTTEQVCHCNTDTNDYIKEVSRAACSIQTHRLLSQPLQQTEGSWLLAGDYTVLPNRISRVRGQARLLQNSRYAVLQRGQQKRHWVLPVPVFIQILPRAPVLRWNLNVVMLSGALRKAQQCLGVLLSALAAPEICAVCSAHQLLALQVEWLEFKASKDKLAANEPAVSV